MKKIFYSIFVFSAIIFFSCTPENQVNTGTPAPFTLKYEITTSVPIEFIPGTSVITYYNGTGQQERETFTSGTTWTKEVTVTTPNRPFMAFLVGGVTLSTSGTATGKLYVNGREVASQTNLSAALNVVSIGMSYPIN